MKRTMPEVPKENNKTKRNFFKQESVNFGYDAPSYTNYSSPSTTSTIAQPLPGQPLLPPIPPSSSRVPPPLHVFGPVPSQVTPIHAWTHPPWHWIASQPSLPPPNPHEITNTIQREMPLRGNYVYHERFTHNRNNMYTQRNNIHRKNKRPMRFGHSQGQFDQNAYFGTTLLNTNLGFEWQRNNYTATMNKGVINHMIVPQSSRSIPSIPPGIVSNRHGEKTEDQDMKIEKIEIQKRENKGNKGSKPRKPMSQRESSKPWNREDAEKALMTENEYRMKNKVNAQSLIIKFPDPDLNKDIVRLFHPGIRNIHFQNPSDPRYCFIQMAKSVNIDEAVKELEKIKFGTGYLKVEKKKMEDEDARELTPEDIYPYSLFIGNLSTLIKAHEIKSKFPKARVDASRARKSKNTLFAFMRYNGVDDAIADYKKAYGLMWDNRSINLRFLRKRGNPCLLEELKEESNNVAQVEKNSNHVELNPNVNESREENIGQTENEINHTDKLSANQNVNSADVQLQDNFSKTQKSASQVQENTNSQSSLFQPTSTMSDKTIQEQQQQQSWTSQSSQAPSILGDPSPCLQTDVEKTIMLTQIKEEPIDYDEMDNEESDDTDDNENNNEDDFEEDDEDEDIDDDNNYDGHIVSAAKLSEIIQNKPQEEPTDHLDQMFSNLEDMTSDLVS